MKKHYTKELEEVEKFLSKLEEDLNRLKKHQYRDNDDLNYKGIRQIENLFDEINEDYYKPIKTRGVFNNITKNMKAEGIKIKDYLLRNIYIRLCHI